MFIIFLSSRLTSKAGQLNVMRYRDWYISHALMQIGKLIDADAPRRRFLCPFIGRMENEREHDRLEEQVIDNKNAMQPLRAFRLFVQSFLRFDFVDGSLCAGIVFTQLSQI